MRPIVVVDRIGKQYRIGARKESYGSLREELMRRVRNPLGGRGRGASAETDFWAVQDVSFELSPGEVLGVIGRNGAGKSTLLKLLSRVTEPTSGRAELYGRIGSLLEVGTGFHPELTGRENIFLNGSILGMRREEIARKLDAIVEFAEVSRFLDTPVKRYSSGMYLRLAFSVAAHLEPEILIVDEVLAVGDAEFQKKCLGRLADVAQEGRTVLFVSHNLPAVTRLCSRAILLDGGKLIRDGLAPDVVHAYLHGAVEAAGVRSWDPATAPGSPELKLLGVGITSDGSSSAAVVEVDQGFDVQVDYMVEAADLRFRCVIMFFTQGVMAFAAMEPTEMQRQRGMYRSSVRVPANLMAEGEYTVGVSIFSSRGAKHRYLQVVDALSFFVTDPMTGDSARGDYAQNFGGVVRPKLDWSMNPLPAPGLVETAAV